LPVRAPLNRAQIAQTPCTCISRSILLTLADCRQGERRTPAGEVARAPGGGEPGAAVAAARKESPGSRSARAGLRLVHGRVRHRGLARGQGPSCRAASDRPLCARNGRTAALYQSAEPQGSAGTLNPPPHASALQPARGTWARKLCGLINPSPNCPVFAAEAVSRLQQLCHRPTPRKAGREWQCRFGNKATPSPSSPSRIERSGRPTLRPPDQPSALVPILRPRSLV